MKKLKVMVVVGTRPEIIRLSSVIKRFKSSDAIELVLVHTGQNYDYELNEVFFEDLGISKPDYFLNAALSNATKTIGQILISIDEVLESVNPEAFLVLGDTNSCLATIPAKKRKIPIFHMEAGNRCFDQRVPEETNRRIVDCISDVNLTYSTIARDYLIKEGFPIDRVIKTGSPMKEVIHSVLNDLDYSSVLEKFSVEKEKYFIVSYHREENVNSDNFFEFFKILNTLSEMYNYPIIVSTHPRTRNRIENENIQLHENIKIMKPLGYKDYLSLQINSKAVLSDSGTISEESSILGFKALNLREAHERPEAMEEASVPMVGLKEERVLQALVSVFETDTKHVYDYDIDNVSDKVLRIVISYVDYIKTNVWKQY